MKHSDKYNEVLALAQKCAQCGSAPGYGRQMLAVYDPAGNQLICPWNREYDLNDMIPLCKNCRPHKGLSKKLKENTDVNVVNSTSKSVNTPPPHINDGYSAKIAYLLKVQKEFSRESARLFPEKTLEETQRNVLGYEKTLRDKEIAAAYLATISETDAAAILEVIRNKESKP